MRKRILSVTMAVLLLSPMTVNAAMPSEAVRKNADYMVQLDADGVPYWFDDAYYSEKYADLKQAFGNDRKALYNHCLTFGMSEERLVSPLVDLAKYREAYPDLNKAFGDDWNAYMRHYFEFGIWEGRDNYTGFDARAYLDLHADLREAFGDDLGLAARHYIEFGVAENRDIELPEPEIIPATELEPDGGGLDDQDDFTGEVRVDRGDGTYFLENYVNGELVSLTEYDENGVITFATEYAGGRPVKQSVYVDGALAEYMITEYDANGNPIKENNYDAAGTELIRRESTYDANGNCIQILEYHSGVYAYKTQHTYDSAGRRLQSIEHSVDINGTESVNRTYEYLYYPSGMLQAMTAYRPDGTREMEIVYTENGELQSEVFYDADGNPIP